MNKWIKSVATTTLAVSMGIGSVQTFGGNSKFFVDVNENSYGWASEYVDAIASKGIANGVGNNMFAPADTIKRGDFAIFLDKTFNFAPSNGSAFIVSDVSENDYYYQSVINCIQNGAVTQTYSFYPTNYIKRIDAINMIYNSLSNQDLIGSNISNGVSMYSDNAELLNITDKIAVGTLTNIGIISGSSDGMLHPNDTMTRAEMAVVMAKTSEYVDAKKAEIAVKKEEEKQQEKENNKANVEQVEEKENISSGKVDESIVIDSGKKVKIDEINVDIDSQESEALAVTNGSDVSIDDSVIKSDSYAAVLLKDGSNIDMDNITVNAYNIDGAIDVNKGTANIENSNIRLNDGVAIKASAGSEINIAKTIFEGLGKNKELINIVSDPDDEESVKINIKDCTLNNNKGYLFYIRESIADIVIENCELEFSKFINSPYDRKNVQENGNDINVTIKDSSVIGDIDIDHATAVTIDIQEGGYLKGYINRDIYSSDVSIKLSYDGKLELMNDLYVKDFIVEDFNFNNIVDNGFNIYYDDTSEGNYELYSDTYYLVNGGQLLPL